MSTESRLYKIWDTLMQNCNNPEVENYKYCGALGVYDTWHDYSVFRRWAVENGYTQGETLLSRNDPHGDYSPENCAWIPNIENNAPTSTPTLTFEQFHTNITKWGVDRGIYEHSTPHAQFLKAVSEMGELADNLIKKEPIGDSYGDILVCLSHVVNMMSVVPEEAFAMVWDEIKDRKGHMIYGGAFVKDD